MFNFWTFLRLLLLILLSLANVGVSKSISNGKTNSSGEEIMDSSSEEEAKLIDQYYIQEIPHVRRNLSINLYFSPKISSTPSSEPSSTLTKLSKTQHESDVFKHLLNDLESFTINGRMFTLAENKKMRFPDRDDTDSKPAMSRQKNLMDSSEIIDNFKKFYLIDRKGSKDKSKKIPEKKNNNDNNLGLKTLSRIKREFHNNMKKEKEGASQRIKNRDNIYPKSFGFSNLFTDILLQRYPPLETWAKPTPVYQPSIFEIEPYTTRPTYDSNYNVGFTKVPSSTPASAPASTPASTPASNPASFDDLSLGTYSTILNEQFDLERRLGKLDSIFNALKIDSEECKRKIICEISKDAEKLTPLSELLQYETRINKNYRKEARGLLKSEDGVRFLSYIEATSRGKDSYRQCEIYKYHCRYSVKDLIDMDALMVWREVVSWLTVKVLVKDTR